MVDNPRTDPLANKLVTCPHSWADWLAHFHATTCVMSLTGLLHRGFEVRCTPEERLDRAFFYLRLADGFYQFREYWDKPGQPFSSGQGHEYEIRDKAFRALVTGLFGESRILHEGEPPSWIWITDHPELLEAVLYFFRLNWRGDEFKNLPRLGPKDAAKEKAKTFIRTLCAVAFQEQNVVTYVPHSRQRVLTARRAQFVPALHGLGELHRLATPELLGGTEPQVLRAVLRLARETHVRPITSRAGKPVSVEEALACSSPPALVLVQLLALRRALRTFPR